MAEAGGRSVVEQLFDLRGTRVVVTGAASGIGLAMAEVLAAAGARVVGGDRDGEGLAARMAELEAAGGEAHAVVADVAEAAQVDRLFAAADEHLGGVDVVFANAGIGGGGGYARVESGRLAELDLAIWDRVLQIDLTGVILTMRAAARRMVPQRHGKIVVTASVAGLRAEPMVGYPYVAAKAALVNLVRQAALELAHHQVTVNAIAPGPFKTNIGGRPFDAAAEAVWGGTVPLGRMGTTDELKGLVVLLASPASSYLNGATIPIDGGATVSAPEM